jgi:D-2-hydroxyacid dehydrogenase (NADP+)
MERALVYHDMPVVSAIRNRASELTVLEADADAEVLEALGTADIFVTNPTKWSDAFLDCLGEGDWMQATSIGYAAFPVSGFRERGVALTNAATVHDSVVSEHALALALALSRNLGPTLARQHAHEWDREVGTGMWDWKGRQMTVFGLGNIGEAVARRGRAFGLEVYGVKRTPSTYTGTLSRDRIVTPSEFPELLPDTDLLVLTVPLTDATRRAIDDETFAALPDSAVLVNVARGKVVDQDALVDALRAGELAGAGLDVAESEPLPTESPLWDRDDVLITPHVGGRSSDFPDRFSRLFVDNLNRRRAGQTLVNRIA